VVSSVLQNDTLRQTNQNGARSIYSFYLTVPVGGSATYFDIPVQNASGNIIVANVYSASSGTGGTWYGYRAGLVFTIPTPGAVPGLIATTIYVTQGTLTHGVTNASLAATATSGPRLRTLLTYAAAVTPVNVGVYMEVYEMSPIIPRILPTKIPTGVVGRAFLDDMTEGLCTLGAGQIYSEQVSFAAGAVANLYSVPFVGTTSSNIVTMYIDHQFSLVGSNAASYGEFRQSVYQCTNNGAPVLRYTTVPFGGGSYAYAPFTTLTAASTTSPPRVVAGLTASASGLVNSYVRVTISNSDAFSTNIPKQISYAANLGNDLLNGVCSNGTMTHNITYSQLTNSQLPVVTLSIPPSSGLSSGSLIVWTLLIDSNGVSVGNAYINWQTSYELYNGVLVVGSIGIRTAHTAPVGYTITPNVVALQNPPRLLVSSRHNSPGNFGNTMTLTMLDANLAPGNSYTV
jgi:hypothetical protein